MNDIETTLKERGNRYGEFRNHARISQSLQELLRLGYANTDREWCKLHPFQQEALSMICHKLARIVNGDPNYDDSWRDIAGYAQLVVKELTPTDLKTNSESHNDFKKK